MEFLRIKPQKLHEVPVIDHNACFAIS